MKCWTLNDLAMGRGMPPSMIRKIVQSSKIRKQQHRYSWNGWTKNKRMRSEVRIPTWLYLQPEFQKNYFPENADEHEKSKALERLKRDFPAFKTYD